jgi:hypothetical protein
MATTAERPVLRELTHTYHAEAEVLSGHLLRPVNQEIHPQASVALKDRRDGFFFQQTKGYSLEGLVSFASGYTHVSGHRSLKNHGWVTLATSVLEGLNVLDVLTADRVVGQVSTEHPIENGHVPHVTFLGTHFENLRIGGYEVQLELDLGVCGNKPKNDMPYTNDLGFLDRVQRQCDDIVGRSDLPRVLRDEYDEELKQIAEARDQCNGSGTGKVKPVKLGCSLVKSIAPIPVATSFGNVLEIPGFGIVKLGEVEVGVELLPEGTVRGKRLEGDRGSNYFQLTMLNMRLGCIGDGNFSAVKLKSNGETAP